MQIEVFDGHVVHARNVERDSSLLIDNRAYMTSETISAISPRSSTGILGLRVNRVY